MVDCIFELNGEPMSVLRRGALSIPAFSGLGEHANRRSAACVVGKGPIPPGTYYVFDRQSGGLLGPLRDLFTGRDDWFALYADDARIDDEVLCGRIRRGQFRLHPKGVTGRSEGCIVIDQMSDYVRLRGVLRASAPIDVPGIKLKAYGRVVVR